MEIGQIRCRSDFIRISAKKHQWITPGLLLQVDQTNMEDLPGNIVMRVGYTASRKVGGAVERNRAKRRLCAAVARVMPFSAKLGYDYVLIARKLTLTRKFEDLLVDLQKGLEKTGAARTPR